jgi:hypothetical protein
MVEQQEIVSEIRALRIKLRGIYTEISKDFYDVTKKIDTFLEQIEEGNKNAQN